MLWVGNKRQLRVLRPAPQAQFPRLPQVHMLGKATKDKKTGELKDPLYEYVNNKAQTNNCFWALQVENLMYPHYFIIREVEALCTQGVDGPTYSLQFKPTAERIYKAKTHPDTLVCYWGALSRKSGYPQILRVRQIANNSGTECEEEEEDEEDEEQAEVQPGAEPQPEPMQPAFDLMQLAFEQQPEPEPMEPAAEPEPEGEPAAEQVLSSLSQLLNEGLTLLLIL